MKKVRFMALALVLVSTLLVSIASAVNYGKVLFNKGSNKAVGYSRVIRLSNGNLLAAHTLEKAVNSGAIRFYKSTDNGETFTFVSEFTDNSMGWQIGCPTIFEYSPGTILFAYNLFNDNAYEQGQVLKVYKSTNEGASWTYLSTPEPNSPPVWNWEPEFAFSSDGKLQLYYSYAPTLKPYSLSTFDQWIVRRESTDGGATWSSRINAACTSTDNCGMPRIVKVGSTYYMAVEYYDDSGAVHIMTSSDGKSWSSITSSNTMEKANDGWMFSTPALTAANGVLIGMGLRYKDWIWGDDENNGKVVLYSKDGGATWKEMTAPFTIVFSGDKTNWSPTLLPLSSSQIFLITSSDYSAPAIRYDTGPISTP